jgi:hypothetical protein
MNKQQRDKCINALIDMELNDYSYNDFKDVFAHVLIYGTRNDPYYKMDNVSLLEALYEVAPHDLQTFDEDAMLQWVDEQDVTDWLKR